jgi:hypothetical protein
MARIPGRAGVVPDVTGLGRILTIAALAVVFGLAATSLLAAVVGDRWGGPAYARRRGASFAVGVGYLGLGLLIFFAARSQLTG